MCGTRDRNALHRWLVKVTLAIALLFLLQALQPEEDPSRRDRVLEKDGGAVKGRAMTDSQKRRARLQYTAIAFVVASLPLLGLALLFAFIPHTWPAPAKGEEETVRIAKLVTTGGAVILGIVAVLPVALAWRLGPTWAEQSAKDKTAKEQSKVFGACGRELAVRLVPGSISSEGDTVSGMTWNYQHRQFCPACSREPCYVDGCREVADKTLPQNIGVGGRRARIQLRDDACVCRHHAGLVERVNQKMSRFETAFTVLTCVGFAVAVASLIAFSAGVFSAGLIVIGVVAVLWCITAGLLFIADRHFVREAFGSVPRRKAPFVTRVQGAWGSDWNNESLL
jgi:hypothetical protein